MPKPKDDPNVIEGEAVEVESGLTVLPVRQLERLDDRPTPEGTIELAARMATALADIVDKQNLYTVIQGKKFPHVEAWMTIARMDNVVAREHANPVLLEDGVFEAEVDLIRLSDGMVVGHGSAWCGGKGDGVWTGRSAAVRRSMAVTRATSRAFRQQYGWIMALAGYEPTPAEEMPQDAPGPAETPRPAPQPPRVVEAGTPAPAPAPEPSEGEELRIVVSDAVESAVRIVRDAHTPLRWDGPRPKLEIVGKVGNRKHTAIVLGPLAEAAAAFGIAVGDVVTFEGAGVEEITWAEGKPTRKEIVGIHDWMMSDVLVGRDGGWVSVKSTTPDLGLVEEEPVMVVNVPPLTVATGGAVIETKPPGERRQGEPGTWEGYKVKLLDPIQYIPHGQREVAVLRTAVLDDTGEIIVAALATEVEEQLGPKGDEWIKPGDEAVIYGEWKAGGRFVIESVGKPA